jgi:hypothetical protein
MQGVDVLERWLETYQFRLLYVVVANRSSASFHRLSNLRVEGNQITLHRGSRYTLSIKHPSSFLIGAYENLIIPDALIVQTRLHIGPGTSHEFECEVTYLKKGSHVERFLSEQCFGKNEQFEYSDGRFVELIPFHATGVQPKYIVGQQVRVILNERNRTPREGSILGIHWHYKRGCYYYTLRENNRVLTKWYFDDDFELLSGKAT